MNPSTSNVEQSVRTRYSAASQAVEPSLCCPVDYDARYLEVIPAEVIERDYGCGDPSKYVRPGETVLDLGSGGGKICFIASQVVGPQGRVIGVDMNDDMLALARQHQGEVAQRIGHDNISFRKGRIQDLGLDLDRWEQHLQTQPIHNAADWLAAEAHASHLRSTEPLVASESVDVIVSNCVLNLVDPAARRQLFSEMHRVLKRGGRAVISDIVSDEVVPDHLRQDAELWSGCISGAFQQHEFLAAFAEAGFYGMQIVARQTEPWAVVEGIEFRSITIEAYKGKEGPCLDHNQAVIYQGPWSAVIDDDGHTLRRGVPMAVCQKTFEIYNRAPYQGQIIPVPPQVEVPASAAKPYDCRRNAERDPKETKRSATPLTLLPGGDCGPGCC